MSGAASTPYSDGAFDAALDRIESLLGDLLGIEAAAQMVRDYALGPDAADQAPPTTIPLNLPAQEPFTVYPTMPLPSFELEDAGGYQPWIDGAFSAGKARAGGVGAWLKYIADNYYLVDAEAIISAALKQQQVTHDVGTQLVGDLGEVSGNLSVHWESDAKEQFFEWFPMASAVVSALLVYADSAQLSAGAAGDAIRATQNSLMAQVTATVAGLEEAVTAWRQDYDVFPFRPGTGYKFDEIGTAISEKVDQYTDRFPDLLVDAVVNKAVSKVPYSAAVLKGYSILTALETNDVDPKTPPTADEILALLEASMRAIVRDGDQALERLGDKITQLADEVTSEQLLVLQRLPRTPDGSYTP